jgi:hypothetical protein
MANEINLITYIEEVTKRQIVMKDTIYVYFDTKANVESAIITQATELKAKEELGQAKTKKTQEINTACATQIIGGFTSNAVDVAIDRHYQSEETDQLNLIGIVAGGIDDLFKAGIKDINFATNGVITWSYEPHTIAQLVKVLNDGKAYKKTLLQKAYTLKARVEVAITIAQVDAVAW